MTLTGTFKQRRAAAAEAREAFAARQGTLFFDYPDVPGARATDTSIDAADSVAEGAQAWRERCLAQIRDAGAEGLTADECADALKESILYIRPRISELRKLDRIRDSDQRRPNESGRPAIVWIVTPPEANNETN